MGVPTPETTTPASFKTCKQATNFSTLSSSVVPLSIFSLRFSTHELKLLHFVRTAPARFIKLVDEDVKELSADIEATRFIIGKESTPLFVGEDSVFTLVNDLRWPFGDKTLLGIVVVSGSQAAFIPQPLTNEHKA
uniref:Uncharacterized protein n=1 Tax=Romanomermis culicivorax TaxID=13658 RepID=A0A915K5J6_ROMCU